MNNKRHIIFVLMIILLPILLMSITFVVNVVVDPLWVLPQVGTRPLAYCVKDERQNKINRAVHGWLKIIRHKDSLLLGSSRAAFIDTRFFNDENVYNMAVNGMLAREYGLFVKIFSRNVMPPKKIFVGLDFFAFSSSDAADAHYVADDENRLRRSKGLFYSLSKTLDLATFRESLHAILRCSDPDYPAPTYRYRAVRHAPETASPAEKKKHIEHNIDELKFIFTDKAFSVDPKYKRWLRAIKKNAEGAKIVPFITPVSAALFRQEMEEGRLTDYLDWVEEIVDVFGGVYQFGGLNDLTSDISKFDDAHHLYPSSWRPLVPILEGRVSPPQSGAGEYITANNIKGYERALTAKVCSVLTDADAACRSGASSQLDFPESSR